MASFPNKSIHFPLQLLGRAVKQRPAFLLGLCGVHSQKDVSNRSVDGSESPCDSQWNYSIEMLLESIAVQWGTAPSLIHHRELLAKEIPATHSRNRYGDAESVARWRSLPLCVLDLGCDNTELITRYGRQCDGVAMVVLGNLSEAKKRLRQFRGDAIPWIGYWTVAFQAHSADNSNHEPVRKTA